MRLIFWGDTQCHYSNIQENQTALKELLRTARAIKPAAIIHTGDVKDEYSPISQSVIKECLRSVRTIRNEGWRYIILKGNHDRESQSPGAADWLSVLAAHGAEVVTKPRVLEIDSLRVAFLPYIGVKTDLIAAAEKLAQMDAQMLVFHCEIEGSRVNSSGRRGVGITLEQLHADSYGSCFGGHIHEFQQLGDRTWYVGSPFCHDWGEANQTKGHLVVHVDKQGHSSAGEQIATSIPHWYDAEWLEARDVTPEPGAYVRSKVTVTTKKITDQLQAEEKRILKRWSDVKVHIVPELEKASPDVLVLKGASDREKVAQYVAATLPEAARFSPAKAVTYMAGKLDGMQENLTAQSICFARAKAKNVLVFDELNVSLKNLGLVLIRGVNRNWPRRSNGAGKTSLLNALAPIPLFGQTLKKQKSDAWASERTDATAESYLRLYDHGGRKIEITRTRRPHSLVLKIDGVDKSSGLRGTSKKAGDTQGRIERVTGYDLQTLTNAVYIDQSIANGFVFGSQSARMDLVNKFQNLDRFEAAQKLVEQDIKRSAEAMAKLTTNVEYQESVIDAAESRLADLGKRIKETHWEERLADTKPKLDAAIEEHAALVGVEKTYEEMQADVDEMKHDVDDLQPKSDRLERQYGAAKADVARARKLLEAKLCPTCGQATQSVGKDLLRAAEQRLAGLAAERTELHVAEDKLRRRMYAKQEKVMEYHRRVEQLEDEIAEYRNIVSTAEDAAREEQQRNLDHDAAVGQATSQLQTARRILKAALASVKALSVDRELLEFAKKAFHRSGIPVYLSSALCPLLNAAAEDYSEIFSDGKLKVQFSVENGDFVVDVINPAGSGTVEGQSVGESAMAGVIAAFALREAAPKTNLLVLDEPGHGLDQEGARQFAQGLLKLTDRFESILLVTHSPAIETVLAGEHQWVVEKKNGRATLSIIN